MRQESGSNRFLLYEGIRADRVKVVTVGVASLRESALFFAEKRYARIRIVKTWSFLSK
jgi:hypothetical protein